MLLFFLASLALLSLPVYPLVLKVVLSTTTRPTCSLSKLVGTSSLNLLDSTHSLDSLACWEPAASLAATIRRHDGHLRVRLAHSPSSSAFRSTSKGGAQHHYSSGMLALQARRHFVAQLTRLDSLARFARLLEPPRPRRRPPSGATTAILAQLAQLARLARSVRSLVGILTASSSSSTARRPHSARPAPSARRHFTGVVGSRTPTPRRPSPTCPPTCWVQPRAPYVVELRPCGGPPRRVPIRLARHPEPDQPHLEVTSSIFFTFIQGIPL